MNDLTARIAAEQDEQIRREAVAASRRRAAAAREASEAHRLVARPDRVAMWAFLMAIAITIAAAASAGAANSGGVDPTSGDEPPRKGMQKAIATWYGPGLWGNQTACGQKLRRKTVGVAHRKLPCGTEVTIAYKGETLTTEVIDRGPFANDADWDLTQAAAKQLDFTETDEIRTSVERKRK
jgi:rare lipoprotein A (peptidoglycan hydrolase)